MSWLFSPLLPAADLQAGGGTLNISAGVDALTLTEYSATIGLAKNVAAGFDSLTLAEQPATISLARNVQAAVDSLTLTEYAATIGGGLNISATVDALTLAEYPATIGLSLNVAATCDALTLTEYPASLGSTLNVQATTDALTLTEYPATLSFALAVSANTAGLSLTEYPATIDTGEEATRPLGLSPWVEYGKREAPEEQRARIQKMRERMGIVEVVERFDKEQEAQKPRKPAPFTKHSAEAETRSENATRKVLSLQAAREAQADRARLLAVLEAMEARRQTEIRRRMALLLIAAEA